MTGRSGRAARLSRVSREGHGSGGLGGYRTSTLLVHRLSGAREGARGQLTLAVVHSDDAEPGGIPFSGTPSKPLGAHGGRRARYASYGRASRRGAAAVHPGVDDVDSACGNLQARS
jgi:hypothetical protein